MKDVVKALKTPEQYKSSELALAGLTHLLIGIVGFIASRAVVLGNLMPFGLSILAGCTATYTPAAAIGVFIGYFIPAVGSGAFRYIAALFAILAIKLLISSMKQLRKNPFFLSGICLSANFLTAAVSLQVAPENALKLIAEALLSAIGTYFVCRTLSGLKKSTAGLTSEELASLLIVVSILLIGFHEIKLNDVSLGRILGILLILTASKYGGIIAGAISGICVSFTCAISGASSNASIAYSLAGLMAGVFSSLGKYAQIGVLMACTLVGNISDGGAEGLAVTIIEASFGSALFLLIPRSAGIHIGKLLSTYPKVSIPTGIKKSITMRLCLASNALSDVSETVEQVSRELSKINAPDFSTVLSGIEQDACAGCKLRIHCWESKREPTINAILEMTKSVKLGEYAPADSATDEFKGRCIRPVRVGGAVYKHYSDYASRIAAENRIDEVRSVVSDQFGGIASMLKDLSLDFENDEQFDSSMALNVASALKSIDIRADECSSRIDKFGRMTIEFKVRKTPELLLNKLQIMRLVSNVCERDFDIPSLNEAANEIFVVLSERACFSVDIGVNQISASNSSMCGDAYNYFYDGRGHFILILSDGMGTGGRAAVDGAMASGLMSRLIKAGFGYDCSLRILNSSMLFKSTDESLATVDIASIDLYTGRTRLFKAGAAPTLVRRGGRSGKAESSSLPAGILREIGFDKATIKMKVGDIVVMMSDGATSEGTDWIRAEIEAWRDGNAEALADHLSLCAKRRRTDPHEDDITVMAAIIEKAV